MAAAAKIARELLADEIVHHLDENKMNNAPENLQVQTRSEHTIEHNKQRPLSRLRRALRGEEKRY